MSLTSEKVFALPFHLVFKNEAGETQIIPINNLFELKKVAKDVSTGKLVAIDGLTLSVQLFGLLADYCGFLKRETAPTDAGVQVLGSTGGLVADMAELFGGVESGVTALDTMARMAGIVGGAGMTVSPPATEKTIYDKAVEIGMSDTALTTEGVPEAVALTRLTRARDAEQKTARLAADCADGTLTNDGK